MEADKILEGLSQEERLELLERLIQGAMQAEEESLSTEERLERLEEYLWGGRRGFAPWRARWRGRFSGAHGWGRGHGCHCC